MVTVPRLPEQRIPERPLPQGPGVPSIPIEAVGGGRAVQEAGLQARGLVQDAINIQRKARADGLRIEQARIDSEFERFSTDLRLELHRHKGADALNIAEPTVARFKQFIAETSRGITDPALKARVDILGQNHINSFNLTAQTYQLSQIERHQENVYNASREQLLLSAGSLIPDADANTFEASRKLRDIKERLAAIEQDRGIAEGKTQDEIDSAILEVESKMNLSHAMNLLEHAPLIVAEQFVFEHKDRMIPADALRLKKALKIASDRDKATTFVDDIMAEEGLSESEGISRLSKRLKDDPDAKEIALRDFKLRQSEKRRLKDQEIQAAFERAQNRIVENPDTPVDELVSPEDQITLESSRLDTLRRVQENRTAERENKITAAMREEDERRWATFLVATGSDPDFLALMKDDEFADLMSRLSLKHQVIVSKWRREATADIEARAHLRSETKTVERIYRKDLDLEADSAFKTPMEQKKYGLYYDRYLEERTQFVRDHGKITREKAEELARKVLATTAFLPGFFFGPTQRPLVDLNEDDLGRVIIPRDKIEEFFGDKGVEFVENMLTSRGVPVTEERVERLAGALIARDRERTRKILAGEED